jgi:predicted transcriptional regulator
MKKLLFYLSLSLIISHLSNAEQVTTSNILNQNFDSGEWSGTATDRHGSNTIAAHNGDYIQSDSYSLTTDVGLTEAQLQDGFTTNHQFKYWHWNDYESTVQSTVTIVGSDGETTTQTRTYNSTGCGYINCGSYNTGTDSLSISRNSQTDYNVDVRYDFSDTSNSTSHYGVDLKEPSLTITYESQPLDQSIQDEIAELFDDFKPEEDIMIIEDNFTFDEAPIMDQKPEVKMEEMEMVEFFDEPVMMEEMKEEESFDEPMMTMAPMMEDDKQEDEPVMEMVMEFFDDEKKEEKEISEEESNSDPTESANAEESDNQEQKESVRSEKTKTVRLETVLEKIETEVKDIDKNLQLISLVKLSVMSGDNPLEAYNIPFYEPRIIYEDQLNIQDNRLIYTKDLVEYKQNDPIFIQKQQLDRVLQERQNLIKELEVLKNG